MPIFETDEERTYFLTTILIYPAFVELDDNRNDNVNDNRNDIKDQKLTDNEQLVLNAIQMDAAITMEKMASMLGISKATVARATKSLREKKAIDRVGSTKKGKWIILK